MSSFSGTIWLQLMESGAFDDHYPQRLNACFHYLSENAASFAIKVSPSRLLHCADSCLQDLAQKAAFVFSYLSLDVDAGSQNGVMDVFGLFNRSGNGNITLEDFLIGKGSAPAPPRRSPNPNPGHPTTHSPSCPCTQASSSTCC